MCENWGQGVTPLCAEGDTMNELDGRDEFAYERVIKKKGGSFLVECHTPSTT